MSGNHDLVHQETVHAEVYSSFGNVYLVFSWVSLILNPAWVRRVCRDEDVDGIVVLGTVDFQNVDSHRFLNVEYLIYNLDGSFSLISGNGIASASEYLRKRYEDVKFFTFHNEYNVATSVPMDDGTYLVGFSLTEVLSSVELNFQNRRLKGFYLEMPNPHLVFLMDENLELDEFPLQELAQTVMQEKDMDVNISLVVPEVPDTLPPDMVVEPKVLSATRYKVRVWERGVGETSSCGSAAAAITNLLIHLGVNMPELSFRMPGGLIKVIPNPPVAYLKLRPVYLRTVPLRIVRKIYTPSLNM